MHNDVDIRVTGGTSKVAKLWFTGLQACKLSYDMV